MHHPTDRITHTMAFVTPVVEHWLEQEIAQWMLDMKFLHTTALVKLVVGHWLKQEPANRVSDMDQAQIDCNSDESVSSHRLGINSWLGNRLCRFTFSPTVSVIQRLTRIQHRANYKG